MATLADLAVQIARDIKETNVWRGLIPSGADLNTYMREGIYSCESGSVAGSLLNGPGLLNPFTLAVETNQETAVTTQRITYHRSTTTAPQIWTRSTLTTNGSAWSPWARADRPLMLAPSGTNWSTFRESGTYLVRSSAEANTMTNLPVAGAPTTVDVHVVPGTSYSSQMAIVHTTPVRLFVRTSLVVTFPAWTEIGAQQPAPEPVTVPASAGAGYGHDWLLNRARVRRGGVIGTAGLAVLAFRCDHWTEAFEAKVLPLLRKHEIPCTLNLNADNLGTSPNNTPDTTIQSWAVNDGVEIANHGATHTDRTTAATARDEIIGGRDRLQAKMGSRIVVDAWHGHGSGVFNLGNGDVWQYGNLDEGAGFSSTAGAYITQAHAFIEGKSSGFYQPLTGEPIRAASHMTLDVTGYDGGVAAVQTAQQLGRGVTVYVHPGTLDAEGKMTTVQLDDFLGYVAAERAAGRLVVTTVSSMSLCDIRSDHREEILVKADDPLSWTGKTGWTFTGTGDALTIQGTTSAGLMYQNLLLWTRYGWAMGAICELVVTARATGGVTADLKLAATDFGGTDPGTKLTAARTWTLPADGTPQTHRLMFTMPARRVTDNVRIEVGRAAGGAIEIVGPPRLHPN